MGSSLNTSYDLGEDDCPVPVLQVNEPVVASLLIIGDFLHSESLEACATGSNRKSGMEKSEKRDRKAADEGVWKMMAN
jgi:hypothetical protein